MKQIQNDIINSTIREFQPYCKAEISTAEAVEIVSNFSKFANVLLKLEGKRNRHLKTKGEKYAKD